MKPREGETAGRGNRGKGKPREGETAGRGNRGKGKPREGLGRKQKTPGSFRRSGVFRVQEDFLLRSLVSLLSETADLSSEGLLVEESLL
jgi:hypothetical protein